MHTRSPRFVPTASHRLLYRLAAISLSFSTLMASGAYANGTPSSSTGSTTGSACAAATDKTIADTPSIECPSGPQNCDPPIKPGVDPATQTIGPLTKCIFDGDDPPVTLRPDLGTGTGIGFQGMGSTTQAGTCPPPIGTNGGTIGKLSCPVAAVTGAPYVAPFTPPASFTAGLDQTSLCLSVSTTTTTPATPNTPATTTTTVSTATSIPALPCGGVVPSISQNASASPSANPAAANAGTVELTPNLSATVAFQLLNNVFIGTPPSNLDATPQTVPNTLADGTAGCGSGSVLSVPGNSVNLVIPPTTAPLAVNSSGESYATSGSAPAPSVYFHSLATVTWNNSVAGDMITLPNGGTYTTCTDPSTTTGAPISCAAPITPPPVPGTIITFPAGAVLVSDPPYVIWANGGSVATPTSSNTACASAALTDSSVACLLFGESKFVASTDSSGNLSSSTVPTLGLMPDTFFSAFCPQNSWWSCPVFKDNTSKCTAAYAASPPSATCLKDSELTQASMRIDPAIGAYEPKVPDTSFNAPCMFATPCMPPNGNVFNGPMLPMVQSLMPAGSEYVMDPCYEGQSDGTYTHLTNCPTKDPSTGQPYPNGSQYETYLTGQYMNVPPPMVITAPAVQMVAQATVTTAATSTTPSTSTTTFCSTSTCPPTAAPPNATVTLWPPNPSINWPESTVTPPAGSYLSIPMGTPVSFAVDTHSTLSLPAGATFTDNNGNSYTVPPGGTLTALGATGPSGAPQVQLPDGTIVTLPAGSTSLNITTSELAVPAGAAVPLSNAPGAQLTLPQSVSANPPSARTPTSVPPAANCPGR